MFAIAGVGDSAHARLLAACLAAGPAAVASHLSAAWILGLVPRPPRRPAITVPYGNRPRLQDVDVHRSRDLDPGRTRVSQGIPHTDPTRTISDLAGQLERQELTDVMDGALANRTVTTAGLLREAERRSAPGRRGPAQLKAVLLARGMIGGPEPSVLEARTLRLFKNSGIPVLHRELHVGPDGRYRIDFLIAPGLAVEVDGFAHHWSPEAKAHDEARRNQLRLGGMFVLVYDWRDIQFDGHRVAREIRTAQRSPLRTAQGTV